MVCRPIGISVVTNLISLIPSCLPNKKNLKIDFHRSYLRNALCVGPSDLNVDPKMEDTIRTRCWVEVVGGKNKGRVYGARQLAANSGASGSLRHQPSSSSSNVEDVTYLKQRLEARDLAYEELKGQFQN